MDGCDRQTDGRMRTRVALRTVRPVRAASASHTTLRRAVARLPSREFGSFARAHPPRCAHAPTQPPLVGAGPLREGMYGA